MKYIEKKIQNEPFRLKNYRDTTPGAVYEGGYGDGKERPLKNALLKEQGHICAYCNCRISTDLNSEYKPRIEVEHYFSQKEYPHFDLDYENMLGVCNGITIDKNEHCDKSKKEKSLKRLDPRKPGVESLLTYSLDGKIKATANNEDVKSDIELLNLNDIFLEKSRKQSMDNAINDLKKKYPVRQWTKYIIEKEIEIWKSKHNVKGKFKYKPYCQAAIWILELLKKKDKYPAK